MSDDPAAKRTRRESALALSILASACILALLIDATPERASFCGRSLPPCAVSSICGVPCPGCGLTRSISLAAHGKLADALSVNPVGPMAILFCAAGIMIHASILIRGRRELGHLTWLHSGNRLFAGAVVAAWISSIIGSLR